MQEEGYQKHDGDILWAYHERLRVNENDFTNRMGNFTNSEGSGRRLSTNTSNGLLLTDYQVGLLGKPKEQWNINYMPVKFEHEQPSNVSESIFLTTYALDPKKTNTSLIFNVKDGD